MSAFPRLPIFVGLAVTLFSGVVNAKPAKTPAPHYFFPPAPDEPHIQFLASFSSEKEMSALFGKHSFLQFIVGGEAINRPIIKPYGVVTIPGKIFICDGDAPAVEVVDLVKRKMTYLRPEGDAAFGMPINIAVDPDGTRYITDVRRGQVLIFKEDNYVGTIGLKNAMKPVGIAATKDRLYVADMQNHCVRVYEKASRKELFTFPKADDPNKAAKLFSPTNVVVDAKGHVTVSDTGGFFVNVYEADGKYLRTVGTQGLAPGQFVRPKGVAVDREGRTYVVDAGTQIVQIFDAEGRILMYFGDPSRNGGGSTSLPAGVTVDYDNVKVFEKFAAPEFVVEYLVLVTNQTGGEKVSVYGFGHKK